MKILKQSSSIEHLKTIVNDVEKLIIAKEDFIAFIVLALGTEFLGSFIDSKNFNELGQSEIRFKAGISLFKNNWYKTTLSGFLNNLGVL